MKALKYTPSEQQIPSCVTHDAPKIYGCFDCENWSLCEKCAIEGSLHYSHNTVNLKHMTFDLLKMMSQNSRHYAESLEIIRGTDT